MSNGGDDYYPLTIARSDGKGYNFVGSKAQPLDPNETKDVEQKERWEVIIAGHIAQQIFPKTESMELHPQSDSRPFTDLWSFKQPGSSSSPTSPGATS